MFKRIPTTVSMRQYMAQLRKSGFKKIGSGAYATVFNHPANKQWVVKVGLIVNKPENDAYLGYLTNIGRKKSNPLFPRVHSISVHKWVDAEFDDVEYYYVVVLEKLEKLNGQDQSICDYLEHAGYVVAEGRLTQLLPFVSRQVREFLQVIAPLFKNKDIYCDMHSGNFMRRTTGQLVIIDPVADNI